MTGDGWRRGGGDHDPPVRDGSDARRPPKRPELTVSRHSAHSNAVLFLLIVFRVAMVIWGSRVLLLIRVIISHYFASFLRLWGVCFICVSLQTVSTAVHQLDTGRPANSLQRVKECSYMRSTEISAPYRQKRMTSFCTCKLVDKHHWRVASIPATASSCWFHLRGLEDGACAASIAFLLALDHCISSFQGRSCEFTYSKTTLAGLFFTAVIGVIKSSAQM